MKKIISIAVFLFAGVFLSAQTNTSVSKSDSLKTDSLSETMPEFPGGTAAFYQYMSKNIRYPATGKDKEGTVYVSFVVETDGSITNVHVVKEVPGAPEFTTEAIRLIAAMPNWIPGQINGRLVRVSMTEPIKFVLQ